MGPRPRTGHRPLHRWRLPVSGSLEVAPVSHGLVAIRDSRRHDPGDPCVLVTNETWQHFIGRVRAGEYGPGWWPAPPIQVPLDRVLSDRLR